MMQELKARTYNIDKEAATYWLSSCTWIARDQNGAEQTWKAYVQDQLLDLRRSSEDISQQQSSSQQHTSFRKVFDSLISGGAFDLGEGPACG
jgi:hypothetical protein